MIRIVELTVIPDDLFPIVNMKDEATGVRAEVSFRPSGTAVYVKHGDRLFEVPMVSIVENVKIYDEELDEPRIATKIILKKTGEVFVTVHRAPGEDGIAKKEGWKFLKRLAKNSPGVSLNKDDYRIEREEWVRPDPPAPSPIVKIVKEMPRG